MGRLTHYLSGDTAQSWHLLVADDFHLDAGGGGYREALLSFFILCALSGVPLSWSKTAGGDTVALVGFEILHRSCSLGISARRAEWFVRWTREMTSRPVVNMDNFEEGLGRIMYVAGALEYERPFLAPLYKFLNVHSRGSIRKLPSYVAFILRHLSNQVERERHFSCATPRVDPQASETRTGIGGWLPVLNTRGIPDPWLSPWEITPEVLPWVYEKGGKPSLIISTLEALAVLVSLKMFYGEQPESGKKEGNGGTYMDRQPWERICTEQIDDNEVPFHGGVPFALPAPTKIIRFFRLRNLTFKIGAVGMGTQCGVVRCMCNAVLGRNIITVGVKRLRCAEVLFQPGYQSNMKCYVNIREELCAMTFCQVARPCSM